MLPQMSTNTVIPLPTTTSFSGHMYALVRYHTSNDIMADVTVTQTHEEATTTVTLAACAVGWCYAHSDLPLNVSLAESVRIDVIVNDSVYLVTDRRGIVHSPLQLFHDLWDLRVLACDEPRAACPLL